MMDQAIATGVSHVSQHTVRTQKVFSKYSVKTVIDYCPINEER